MAARTGGFGRPAAGVRAWAALQPPGHACFFCLQAGSPGIISRGDVLSGMEAFLRRRMRKGTGEKILDSDAWKWYILN